ncbi:MAG: HEAT repeat domain-containing protein, partial [Phycisphaerae bacterium]|nr:HEAT repeat domain-containing protein [Phycisphaerae bacterium]
RRAFSTVIVAVLVMLMSVGASAATVGEIVAKMPAIDHAEGAPLIAEIIKAGPAGLKELCGMITPPDDTADAKARFALHGVVLHAMRPGAETERAMLEKALLDALASAKQADLKQFFVKQIELCGSDVAAKALGKLLSDARLCETATRALLRIRTNAAIGEIRGALDGAKGASLVTIVRALGQARDKASAKAIAKYAGSADRTLRHTAWFALANIGEASATDVLKTASLAKGPYERSVGLKNYMLLARRLGEGTDKTRCANICRGVLSERTGPTDGNARCAALTVLSQSVGRHAVNDVLAALDDKNAYVRDRAARILSGMKASGASAKLIARYKTASPATKAAILGALGLSGDKDKNVIDTLQGAASDTNKDVRIAAIAALAQADPDKGAAAAAGAMKSTEPDEVAAARGVLLGVKSKNLSSCAAGALANASPEGKAALLEVLAARGATNQVKAVILQLDSKEAPVAQAAAKAMGDLAGADDISVILAKLVIASDSRQRASLQSAAVAAMRRTSSGAKPVMKALSGVSGDKRALLLKVLSGIGGDDALQLVVKDTASDDKVVKEAAVRALANWPEIGAAKPLLTLMGKTDNKTHRTLALRGYVRLISLPSNRSAAETVKLFAAAMDAAPGEPEKKLVLGGLSGIRTVEAMGLAMKYVDDPKLREEAAMAAVRIACPARRRQKLLKGADVKKNLQKILAVTKNKWTRETASKYAGKK